MLAVALPTRLIDERCGAHGVRRGGAVTVVERCSDLARIVLGCRGSLQRIWSKSVVAAMVLS